MTCQAQNVVISSTEPSWQPNTIGVPQQLTVGLVLFSLFNDLDDGMELICAWYKNGRVADIPKGHAAIQTALLG